MFYISKHPVSFICTELFGNLFSIYCYSIQMKFFKKHFELSPSMTKPIWLVHPAKTQISLGIRPVWPAGVWLIANDQRLLHADSEDSDQTGRMPWLIWVVAGRTFHFVGFVVLWLRCLFLIDQNCFELNEFLYHPLTNISKSAHNSFNDTMQYRNIILLALNWCHMGLVVWPHM